MKAVASLNEVILVINEEATKHLKESEGKVDCGYETITIVPYKPDSRSKQLEVQSDPEQTEPLPDLDLVSMVSEDILDNYESDARHLAMVLGRINVGEDVESPGSDPDNTVVEASLRNVPDTPDIIVRQPALPYCST
ncbi:uncharacterized protein DMAD_02447 [Drosophila madeirensis]|uniref:Uncharacterized protein n=1 Tax=Drosophila madeirensis TaxID=30013 RepID=A0AAU9G3P4_DROMD